MREPRIFPDYEEDSQLGIYGDALRFASESKKLDTLTTAVRYKIPPKEVSMIINFSWVEYQHSAFKNGEVPEEPKMTPRQMCRFIDKYHAYCGKCLLLQPLQASGFEYAFKFLRVFGGLFLRVEQFDSNSPFSYAYFVRDLVGEMEVYEKFESVRRPAGALVWLQIPSLVDYLMCFPRSRKKDDK